MKGIIVDVQPKALRTSYTPLNSQFNLTLSGGGSTTQFYYTESGNYAPNRAITPIRIAPLLYIVDPEGIIGSGNKTSQLSVTWYENSVNTPIVTGTHYTVNPDGTLTVKKNVPVATPLQIICRAQFTDTRSGRPIIFEEKMVFNTIPEDHEKETRLVLDKDVITTFNPVTDNKNIAIKATLYIGKDLVPAANCVYWWYKVVNGLDKLLGDDVLDIEYVSGQGTHTLNINAQNVEQALYRCRAVKYTGTKPSAPPAGCPVAETTLKWKLPAPLRADIYSPMGQAIRPGMTDMTFTCRIFDNVSEITDVGKYFFIKWFKKSTAAGANAIEVGHGVSITLPVSSLTTVGGVQMMVYPEVTSHGPYEVLADNAGDYLTDNNGNILIGY